MLITVPVAVCKKYSPQSRRVRGGGVFGFSLRIATKPKGCHCSPVGGLVESEWCAELLKVSTIVVIREEFGLLSKTVFGVNYTFISPKLESYGAPDTHRFLCGRRFLILGIVVYFFRLFWLRKAGCLPLRGIRYIEKQ